MEKYVDKPAWINGTKMCRSCFIKVKRLSVTKHSWSDYYNLSLKKYATKKDINTIKRINKFVEELKKQNL